MSSATDATTVEGTFVPLAGIRGAAARNYTLKLAGISHQFGRVVAVSDANLIVGAGQFVVLLGPSGCGKTTLLRIIAGLIKPSAGRLFIDNTDITKVPPEQRRIGIVFQNYALFPHMTVFANIAYGLEARKVGRKEIGNKVKSLLGIMRLEKHERRLPRELSGGQQQRVALARALAIEPHLLLLDEPFGALDKNLRLDMQIEVRRIQRELGITTVMVTHDQEEALSISDLIAIMNHGKIVQFGSPANIYDDPADRFVAGFVGTMNILPGELLSSDGETVSCRFGSGYSFRAISRGPLTRPGAVSIGIRPENFSLSESGTGMMGEVVQILPLGPLTQVHVRLQTGQCVIVSVAGRLEHSKVRLGVPVSLSVNSNASCSIFEP